MLLPQCFKKEEVFIFPFMLVKLCHDFGLNHFSLVSSYGHQPSWNSSFIEEFLTVLSPYLPSTLTSSSAALNLENRLFATFNSDSQRLHLFLNYSKSLVTMAAISNMTELLFFVLSAVVFVTATLAKSKALHPTILGSSTEFGR